RLRRPYFGKMSIRTLNEVFLTVVDRNSDRVVLTREGEVWQPISSAQLRSWVYSAARQLQAWGIGKGDRVVILSENRVEWAIADYATLLLGAVVVPIYATQVAEQVLYMLQNSEARVAFVSSRQQYEKLASIREQTSLERVIVMDAAPELSDAIHMQSFLRETDDDPDPELDAIAAAIEPDDLATLIYTSGTTGTPKGVMLTHGNIASNVSVSLDMFDVGKDDLSISYLPLSHITARHLDYALQYHNIPLAYCPNIDDLARTMREVKPTIIVAVPRVYEKVHNQVQHKMHGVKGALFKWALKVGAANREAILRGETPTSLSWKLANALVYSKVREGLGGRARLFVSGGAPLGKEIATWYADIGIRIHEGYGLTETSPVIALNNPIEHRLGAVGKPLPNVEIKIAPDGELLVRGPSVFKGYWKNAEETANAFENGWFKTGDVATLDADGFLHITDRKKDLIKTSGGKFIAPQPIENSLKANLLVGEAALLGDKRKFPAVLIVPNFAELEEWAQHHGVKFSSHKDLVKSPHVQSLYEGIVEELNRNLAQYEKLKKVLVIHAELSIADGTLTPSMKLRRRHLEERYHKEIDALYASAQSHTRTPAPSGAAR
ncbi:MAG TPA: long-chain fatty acid--CoA ligase, partial [Terracidiphilus sp.]|nr:long-chain fatty acid--CoA ligase [Terracidiphilus sp.]